MANRYHIKINPPEPAQETIDGYRDFDGLLDAYQRRQRQRRRRLGLGYTVATIAAAAALALLFWFQTGRGDTSWPVDRFSSPEAYFASQPVMQPPIPEAAPAFASLFLEAELGDTLSFGGGSRLIVPAGAFQDELGQPVRGAVDIQVRTMTNPVDFFLTGVPMHYDSAGTRYQMESAGMVEVYAAQAGRQLRLVPGKSIAVELFSEIFWTPGQQPKYNVYHFDTIARRWTYQGVDDLSLLPLDLPATQAERLEAAAQLLNEKSTAADRRLAKAAIRFEQDQPRPVAPQPPRPYRQDRPTIELELEDFEQKAIDLDLYEGTIWQIDPQSPAFDARIASVEWTDVQLIPLEQDRYQLILSDGANTVELLVNPVLLGEDFESARARYEDALAEHEKALAEWETRRSERLSDIAAAVEQKKAEAQQTFEQQVADLLDDRGPTKRRVVNRFTVNKLGVWNCDRLIVPEAGNRKTRVVGQDGRKFTNQTLYAIKSGENTLYRYYASSATALPPFEQDHLLWVVTDAGGLALGQGRLDEAETINTLVLERQTGPVDRQESVRQAIQL